MSAIRERELGEFRLRPADLIEKNKAPMCQICGKNRATAATIQPSEGVVENVCPTCQDYDLDVVVTYI